MPELPEVETTKASLAPLLGKTVSDTAVSGFRLREPIADVSCLVGATFVEARRRAKYLLLDFKKANHTTSLLVHLGMSGSLQQHKDLLARKHDHVIWYFGDIALHYHDPRRFGIVAWQQDALRYLDKLGVEPLSQEFCAEYLYGMIHKHPNKPVSRPIKAFIMEQSVVVGVGNIYATESLFLAKIHPSTPACAVSKDQLTVLVGHIKEVLSKAITLGGTTLRDFTVGEGKTGYFAQTLLAYGRQGLPCVNCHLPLENQKIVGRASVFCPSCQPWQPNPIASQHRTGKT